MPCFSTVRGGHYVDLGLCLRFSVDMSLAHGAQAPFKPPTDLGLPAEEREILGIKDWALVLRAFNNWSLAPEVGNTVLPLV